MTTLSNFHASAVARQRVEAVRRGAEQRAREEAEIAAARAEGAAAERARCAAIYTSAEGQASPDLANRLMFETALTPEAAIGVLRGSARKEAPPADIPTIAQRAEDGGVIGASFAPMGEGKDDAWAEVLERTKGSVRGRGVISAPSTV